MTIIERKIIQKNFSIIVKNAKMDEFWHFRKIIKNAKIHHVKMLKTFPLPPEKCSNPRRGSVTPRAWKTQTMRKMRKFCKKKPEKKM